MKILAIDPGNEQSAYVEYADGRPFSFAIVDNATLVKSLRIFESDILAIEMVACYGMPVGRTVFETCVWIGRFIERWNKPHALIYRKDVKMYLCNSMRAKDPNVRQAIIDRYEPTGGGATPQIGTKSQPGPLYGVSKDIWAALGVAITYENIRR